MRYEEWKKKKGMKAPKSDLNLLQFASLGVSSYDNHNGDL